MKIGVLVVIIIFSNQVTRNGVSIQATEPETLQTDDQDMGFNLDTVLVCSLSATAS